MLIAEPAVINFTPKQLRHIVNHSRDKVVRRLAFHLLREAIKGKWK